MNIYLNGKGNVYLQIVEQYKRYISLGVLKNGEKLPSCRNLAFSLGVNPNTVARAFKTLEDEHYIINIEKKGVYVSFNNVDANDEKIKDVLYDLKNQGISEEKIMQLIHQIYEEDNHD